MESVKVFDQKSPKVGHYDFKPDVKHPERDCPLCRAGHKPRIKVIEVRRNTRRVVERLQD